MNRHHKQRLIFIVVIISSIAMAASLALYALQQNINLFYSPTQIVSGVAPVNHEFRLGGIVAAKSVQRAPNSLQISFDVTDQANKVRVNYTGVLPDLFREGQSVVVEGKLNAQGVVIADQVLAKHDERYMPAAVKEFMKKAPA